MKFVIFNQEFTEEKYHEEIAKYRIISSTIEDIKTNAKNA
jgi:hypothetical protein